MRCFLIDAGGAEHLLPTLCDWRFCYGSGQPCDSFELCFLYERSMLPVLEAACRFKAVFEDKTVFFGVADEFEISVSEKGCTAFVSGRGLAALLLDNEVSAAEFLSIGLDTILERYVFPFGIKKVHRTASPPSHALTIGSGSSAWRVLEDFLWFGCKLKPRFLPDGTLLIGEAEGERLLLGRDSPFSMQKLRKRRYGVLSEIVIRNKVLGTSAVVENREFLDKGGCCRRILNVPRRTGFDLMRMTGDYQLQRSREKEFSLTVSLPFLFAAFPGDVLELSDSPLGIAGDYIVGESCCYGDGNSAGTEIILTRRVK